MALRCGALLLTLLGLLARCSAAEETVVRGKRRGWMGGREPPGGSPYPPPAARGEAAAALPKGAQGLVRCSKGSSPPSWCRWQLPCSSQPPLCACRKDRALDPRRPRSSPQAVSAAAAAAP